MADLIKPHGSDHLVDLLLDGAARQAEIGRAASLPRVTISSREAGDLIMLGIGGFTPLTGFMGQADWEGVCRDMKLTSGVFWPIPITLSADQEMSGDIALVTEDGEVMATMKVEESYTIDREFECQHVFGTTDP